jgi:two-component system, OmpR family, sensor histidine kinase BaeS
MIAVVMLTTLAIGWLLISTFIAEGERLIDAVPKAQQDQVLLAYETAASRAWEGSGFFDPLLLPLIAPFIVAILMALFLASRVTKPLEAISKAARAVARGQFGTRVELDERHLHRNDEASELARNFNHMAESLEKLESERLATSAAIAHELRTPLTVLRSRLQAVRDDVMPFNEAEANLLIEQTELLTRLVDDLKTLSLADAGQLRLEQRSFDLTSLVKQTLAGFELRAVQKNLRLELRAPDRLEIRGDPARLQQVLGNLLENALRYAQTSITLEIAVQNKQVRFQVCDDGVGIPEQDLERIFTRFYRVESSRSRESGGSGLGLAIAQTLIELHHGQIRAVRSTRGAKFEITLPI